MQTDMMIWVVLGLSIGLISTSYEEELPGGKFLGSLTLSVLAALLGGVLGDLTFKGDSSVAGFASTFLSILFGIAVFTLHKFAQKEETSIRLSNS